jgi:hypothetical protein
MLHARTVKRCGRSSTDFRNSIVASISAFHCLLPGPALQLISTRIIRNRYIVQMLGWEDWMVRSRRSDGREGLLIVNS